jgi:hypothetical protein
VADDLAVGVLVLGEHFELRLQPLHGVAEGGLAKPGIVDADVVAAVGVQRQGEAARTEVAVEAVDGDQLLHPDAVLVEAALQRRHLRHVLVQPGALDVPLLAHVLEVVVFVDPADDGGRRGHRADHAGQDEAEGGNGDDHAPPVEENVPDAATDVARHNLDFDHRRCPPRDCARG